MQNKLVLASTSPYRKDLLKRLGLSFHCEKPKVNEEKIKFDLLNELKTPIEIAEALSWAKAFSVSKEPYTTIIAGDQLVDFENQIIGKPNTTDLALKQLQNMNGKTHQLITSVVILHENLKFNLNHISVMKMKKLSDLELKSYIELDQPLDCSGSYKIESHGIALFEEIKTDDFTAIQGLPLIWISQKLKEIGHEFFKS